MRRTAAACCLAASLSLSACSESPKSLSAASYAAAADQTATVPITTRSEEARTLYLQGRALAEQLRAHDANVRFEQAVAKEPTFALAEYNLSLTAFTTKERSEHLKKAVALAKNASEGEQLLILARQAAFNADPAKVQEYASTLVARYPRDERAHWVLGNAYLAQQQYDRAVAEYQAAIAINPSYSSAYNSLGYAYRPMGNLTEAEKAFQRYIALVPNDPNPYDSYAELLMKMGRFDASIAQYRKALSIEPAFGGSHVGIAADHMFAGQHDASIAELTTYFETARDDVERRAALFNQVLTYVDKGETDQALRLMDRLSNVARASGDTANLSADAVATAEILLDAGRVDAARDRFQQAHELVANSDQPADVKQDDELARHYDLARIALAKHDVATAHAEAGAYLRGAEAKRSAVRVRQAHQLNGLVALEEQQFEASLAELAQANQQDAQVLDAMARACRGKGDAVKAKTLAAQAANLYELPTLSYVFIRAKAKHAS